LESFVCKLRKKRGTKKKGIWHEGGSCCKEESKEGKWRRVGGVGKEVGTGTVEKKGRGGNSGERRGGGGKRKRGKERGQGGQEGGRGERRKKKKVRK